MTPSNVVYDTLNSSCDSGSSVCHACWVSQLATGTAHLNRDAVADIRSRADTRTAAVLGWCLCSPLGLWRNSSDLVYQQAEIPSSLADRNTEYLHVSIVWLCSIWLKRAKLWFCPLFCVDVKLSPSGWRKNKEWGCAEENIWTGEGASKKRPEKFYNEEIFCTPPEILVVW